MEDRGFDRVVRVSRLHSTAWVTPGSPATAFTTAASAAENDDASAVALPSASNCPGETLKLDWLSFAAREADIVSIVAKALPQGGLDGQNLTLDATKQKLEWVRDAAGDRDPELNVLVYTFEVTDDREGAVRRYSESLELSPDEVLASPHVLIGTVEQIAEDLRRRRDELGISYIVLNTNDREHTGQFAPVIAELAGT